MTRDKKRRHGAVHIRQMCVNDVPVVYRLGRRLFQTREVSMLYRTWDAYEVTQNFNQDPRLSLVAESPKGRIVGFALGTTYENESGGWKYGHVLWMGVSPKWQRSHVGAELYHEMERRMHRDGVRMAFIDAPGSNSDAIRFFKRMGYGKPETEVWMSKTLHRTREDRTADKRTPPERRKRHNRLCRRVSSKPFLTKTRT